MYQITFATLFVAQYNGTFVTYGVIRFVQYTILPVLSDLYKTDTAGHFKRGSSNQEFKEFNSSVSYVFLTDKDVRAIYVIAMKHSW